jgi:glycine hydroxymethyltransferase
MLASAGVRRLIEDDHELYSLVEREYVRQQYTLSLLASCSTVDPSVLACEALPLVNVTAEGYPGDRFHAGCQVIDGVEQLAIDRAKTAFRASYANVQPHSASAANEIVYFSLLNRGDTLLGMRLDQGGHLTHGAKASISGRMFHAIGYGLDAAGGIDYQEVERLALQHRPKLIVCGATAYARTVEFARFRRIADAAGAILVADISHIAGLVAAGLHPSPIDQAHITTTCTHKQLFGPRGGLIMMGRDAHTVGPDGKRTLAEVIQSGVFPLMQGAPMLHTIAAKARALARVTSPEFAELAARIQGNAAALAEALVRRGYRIVTGGTDNHIVLVDVGERGISGLVAEQALERCDIVVNRNKLPGDTRPARVTSGIRLGTNNVAFRLMRAADMDSCAAVIDSALRGVTVLSDREFVLDADVMQATRTAVRQLCERFPIPSYSEAGSEQPTGRYSSGDVPASLGQIWR